MRWLASHAARLAGRPEVQAVVLFGSVARDRHTGRSDADLLVIVSDASLPFPERAAAYAPGGGPLPVDTFVYTVEEAERTPLARRACSEGLVLFAREGFAAPGERR